MQYANPKTLKPKIMQTLKLTEQQFLAIANANADLHADSATYAFFSAFFDLLFCEGGDDHFADQNSNYIALLMTCLLPYSYIEAYDNATDEDEQTLFETAYQFIKSFIL